MYTPEVTNYLYDRQNVILETDANNNVKARYIKGINYIAKAAAGKESYFLYNGHGDVVQTVNETGTVQNRYDYDIWGNPILTIETTQNAIRYTGEFYDEETGLYYLRARYYDPYLGRFTTEDSYWGEDENPLSLNLYTYCHNDPIQYVDPTGHMTMYELESYFGKEAAQKYKHEAEPDPTPKGITLKEVADITAWSKDSSKATFTIGGVKKDLYIDKGIVYDSWGYERGTVIDGHINVSEYEYKNLFGSSSSPGSSSSRESTLTVNSWENMTSVHIRDNTNATINNYGIMDTITGGKNSHLVLNNYGKVNNEVRIGENGTAKIYNHENAYIKDIKGGDITDNTKKGVYIENRGTIGTFNTGKNSRNEVNNKVTGTFNRIITGAGNNTQVRNASDKKIETSGDGKIIKHMSYVFYDKNANASDGIHTFKDEAEIRADYLREEFGSEVILVGIESASEFKNQWNNILGFDEDGKEAVIDGVFLIFHGSIGDSTDKDTNGVGYLIMSDGSKVAAANGIVNFDKDKDVSILGGDLERKEINLLNVAACNSGHLDVINVAWAFTNSSVVYDSVGWDSAIVFDYKEKRNKMGGAGKNWEYQPTWKKYVIKDKNGKPARWRSGEVHFGTPILSE